MAKLLELRRGTTAENDLFTGALAEPTYDTDRKELRIHDGSTQGGKVISLPVGLIATFGGSTAPKGWLLCDGSAVSRTDYADLFDVIGTTYGDGDGSTTFNLPEKYVYTGAVIGSGEVLGLTDGNGRSGVIQSYVWNSGFRNGMGLGGEPVNRTLPTSYTDVRTEFAPLGVDTNPTKSGIICQKDNSVLVCIKY